MARAACVGSSMHTQTETSRTHLPATASRLQTAAGLGLYLLTLTVEVLLGASVRWLLTSLGAATAGLIVPLGLSAETLAWVAAVAPLLHSALALIVPGSGWIWPRRLGARRPSAEESVALEGAFTLLCGADGDLERPAIWVLDDPLPGAAVRGGALVLNRGLIESESLPAVLAHELGHFNSLDGRLTEAVQRLMIWNDPLSPHQTRGGGDRAAEFDPDPRGGLLWNCLRWTLRFAGGGLGHRALARFWAVYWRSREHAADAYAASLGQAEDLARHLTDFEQAFDSPQPRVLLSSAEHPPVADRIDRLLDH